MSKEKKVLLCFFCHKPVDVGEPYYMITGPDGQEAMVHGHTGVEEHGGTRMWKGQPYPKDDK